MSGYMEGLRTIATGDIALPVGCTFATLVLSHIDPLTFLGSTVVHWEAQFTEEAGVIDDFNRTFTPSNPTDS